MELQQECGKRGNREGGASPERLEGTMASCYCKLFRRVAESTGLLFLLPAAVSPATLPADVTASSDLLLLFHIEQESSLKKILEEIS